MRAAATDAKNRFGALRLQARTGPVVVEKAGEPNTVWMPYAVCRVPCADCQRPQVPPAARRKQFNAQHREWLHAHSRQHDATGLWNDDLRLG